MKTLARLLTLAVVSISTLALAESAGSNSSFATMKALAGEWEGSIITNPPEPSVQGKVAHVTLRVTSMGNALLHEMNIPGRPDDPITMFYQEDGRLILTHYCDAGNRPRMEGKPSSAGKGVEFSLLNVSGSMEEGHMHGAAFSVIEPDHHTEDWTFMVPGKGPVQAHFDLRRKK